MLCERLPRLQARALKPSMPMTPSGGDLCEDFLHDIDCATDFGTAFHLCAQQAACLAPSHGRLLKRPSDERIAAVAKRCGLGQGARRRLAAWPLDRVARKRCGLHVRARRHHDRRTAVFHRTRQGIPMTIRIASVISKARSTCSCRGMERGGMQDVRRSSITKREDARRIEARAAREASASGELLRLCCVDARVRFGRSLFRARVEQSDAAEAGQPEVVRSMRSALTISTLYACESTRHVAVLRKNALPACGGDAAVCFLRVSRVACRVSRVACRVSRVACRVSRVACRVSRVACRVSRVACRVSRVACRVSRVACRLI